MAKKNKFDPKNTHVDQLAIPRLSATAAEARRILYGKTSDEIRGAQETIDGWIDAYFETAFEDEVNRLRSLAERGDEEAMAYFRVERHLVGDDRYDYVYYVKEFNDLYRDRLDIASAENTTQGEALDYCIDWFDLSETNFGADSEPLFFAALALKHVERAVNFLNAWRDPDSDSKKIDQMLSELHCATDNVISLRGDGDCAYPSISLDYQIACEAAIDAREDVVLSAKYSQIKWMKRTFDTISAQAVSTAEKERFERQHMEEIRKKQERVGRMNKSREEKRRAAESFVLEHWQSDTSQFPTAREAGEFYSEWLKKIPNKNFNFTATTCRDWVRNRAKELGLKWR
ncbi:hypothetical protein [Burkholderia glumae]|uniref:hypothetical protein n=1 Tax=Burkholderia glumae TaxID=337 RepID=UPI002151E673|nr:hypothetical protein [Burkholderia glumae]